MMREGQRKYWKNGFDVRGGYFWTLAFRIGKYGIMFYYPMYVAVYRLF